VYLISILKKTGIVKSTIELLESKDPKSLSRELQRIMKREGTYVDYSDEEVAQILNGFESRTKNKIKPAEEMIDEGDFDPSGFAGGGLAYMLGEPVRMFKGGRIGYSVGAGKKGVQGLLDLVKNKFGKKSITTADKIGRPESAVTRDMFKQFNERLKQKDLQKEYKQGDPITSENFGNTPFAPDTTDLKKAREMKRQLTDDEIEDYEEILGDSETWMNEGTVEEAEAAVKRRKEYEQQMYSEYKVEKQARKELEQAYKEIDFRMTGEDTKYEANELADMLAETRYKTEMSDLPQKTQIDLYGEAYDYLMEVKRDAANFKGATNIKTGKNIVTGEQELPLDPLTGKPRKLNAEVVG
jgi:cellobiose-specific phosphotransferase system component IIB